MGTDYFDGYTGIRLGDGQFFHDVLLLSVIVLLTLFSIIFKYFYPLFVKMGKDLRSLKERQSIFDTSVKKNVLFDGFMQFQALFLVTVFCFLAYCRYTGKQNFDSTLAFGAFVAFFFAFLIYFMFKRFIYYMYGHTLSEQGEDKLWAANYDTICYIWEMLLYLPVLWLVFDSKQIIVSSVLFVLIYILFRIAVIYITVRIFYSKNTGFLYLNMYLCAQEIIPLFLLYEGFKYLHNIVQTSAIWH